MWPPLQPLKIEWDLHFVKTRKCRIVCLVTVWTLYP
jgi:hypothetical protein